MGETQTDQKDVKTSEGQEGNTSEQETPTLTKKQAEALASKARNDALAEVGRLKKAADDATRLAQSTIQRLQKYEDDRLKAEEEAAKDDPAKLSALQMRRQAIQDKAAAEEERQKLEKERTEIQTQRQEIMEHRAERLSEKYNVDTSLLLKYGGATRESMEELAKSFGERKAGEPQPQRMTTPPDSGKTKGSGTGKTPTLEELKASTPDQTAAKIKSGEWTLPGWQT